jgi:AbrB family looped-hinge helix DNA binding protein
MEIVGVVTAIRMGTPGSYYLLIPAKLREKLNITEDSEFVVKVHNDEIIYQRKKKEA